MSPGQCKAPQNREDTRHLQAFNCGVPHWSSGRLQLLLPFQPLPPHPENPTSLQPVSRRNFHRFPSESSLPSGLLVIEGPGDLESD